MNYSNKTPANANGNRVLVAVFVFLLPLILTGTQTGCSPKATDGSTVKTNSNQETRAEDQKRITAAQTMFFKIAILSDKSGSVDSTRTPFITMEQLEELIDFLRRNSGEIAFGFIDDDSNQPFQRLRIEARETPPSKPELKNNPYEQEKLLNKYITEMNAYKSRDRRLQAEINRRVEVFKSAVQPMIDCLHDNTCRSGSTDVFESLRRADLFLTENEAVANQTNILVLITDGLETVRPGAAAPILKSQPRIIVVNGSASLGVLKKYQVEPVENIDAAIRQITRLQPNNSTSESAAVLNR